MQSALIKLANDLDVQGLHRDADLVDSLIVEAGIKDMLKNFMGKAKGLFDQAKAAAVKKVLETMKPLVKMNPDKVADYLISLKGWIAKVKDGFDKLKEMAPAKKASYSGLEKQAGLAAPAFLVVMSGVCTTLLMTATQTMKELQSKNDISKKKLEAHVKSMKTLPPEKKTAVQKEIAKLKARIASRTEKIKELTYLANTVAAIGALLASGGIATALALASPV